MATVKRMKRSVPKGLTVGVEVEFFVLDKLGRVAPGADAILKKIDEKAGGKPHNVVKECAKNLIEVGSYPDPEGHNAMLSLIEGLKTLLYAANECGYTICPLATYPGTFTPALREDANYKVQLKLFGRNRFQVAGRCAGFHCHHTLPRGVFDAKELRLKSLRDSKHQESLVHAYNLLVALDPAFTTFTQSSPFYQGRHLAKDSRMLVYRGGEDLGYIKGLYTNYSSHGALPSYVHSGTDLIHHIEARHENWKGELRRAGIAERRFPSPPSILDTNWSPVKVNAHGTLEQRGMDMNHLPILLSIAVLMRGLLKHVEDGSVKVVPHDSAKNEPFKLAKDTVHIPPEAHVKKHLQKLSAYEGLANDEVYVYCKRLVHLVKTLEGDSIGWLFKPIETMLQGRQTTAA